MHLMLALTKKASRYPPGAACSAHKRRTASYILMAMGNGPVRARGSLGITLGRFNTDQEADNLYKGPAAPDGEFASRHIPKFCYRCLKG